jgi:ribosomal protein S18 acetylase RimI-like enzyme
MINKKPISINENQTICASKADCEPIANFLNLNPHIHRHLDWFSPLEWLGKQPFLIEKAGDQIQAILCAVPENQETAWIRVFGIQERLQIGDLWQILLEQTIKCLRQKKISHLASLSLHSWFQALLEESGFDHRQNIVVLEWQGELSNSNPTNPDVEIRTMKSNDLSTVEKIDRLAFPPLWQNSTAGLTKAFHQTGISTVAVINGKLVGYQISTAMTIYGHLARLAVHPNHQNQRIAYTLVQDLLKRFEQRGFWRVTVNTQSDNIASLKLYDKFNFEPTGEEIPVFERKL